MANVGLKSFLYGELTESTSGTATYAAAKKLAGAIEAKVSVDLNSATIYRDDALGYEDTSFKKGTITLGIDDDDETIFATLLGKKVATESFTPSGATEAISVKKITSSNTDAPIPVGFGYVTGKQQDSVRKYKVQFFKKVTFKPFQTDSKTRGESLEFTTPSVEGTISTLADGTWKDEATFDTEALAIAYLKSLYAAA